MNPKLLFLIPLLPLAAAAVNLVAGRQLPRRLAEALAVGAVGLSAVVTLAFWPLASGEGTRAELYTWLASGELQVPVEIVFDPLSASMTLMVTFVSTLIHLYAVGYMTGERDYARFFALLNLFVFAMLTIVLADNLLLLFLGWEGVGFCSYALIGYWYSESKNADAGRKAFLVTRTGDVFLGIALLWLFTLTGTLSIGQINQAAGGFGAETLFWLTLLLLGGACGKSAQLPLMTWLPDAMAGPTPVSALIHAATMVTAGVYLLARLFPLVSLSPAGMASIAAIGALTALYAASCALAQREIKRVLAYSTMSQVGYMFLAVGLGTVSAGMFHLITHAFFKALLFMGAGCVIHLSGENDIFRMSGLARRSPLVFWSFLAGALCLAGAPLTSGFFSKDAILLAAFAAGGPFHLLLWGIGLLTALLTAFYTFRMLYLVFAGQPRDDRGEHHHLPAVMRWTLPPLAVLALIGGLLNLPAAWGGTGLLEHFLGDQAGREIHPSHAAEWGLAAAAAVIFLAGWLLARRKYASFPEERVSVLSNFLLRGWEADRAVNLLVVRPFDALARLWQGVDRRGIDGLLEGTARLLMSLGGQVRRATTGRLHGYLGGFAWGLLFVLAWMVFRYVG